MSYILFPISSPYMLVYLGCLYTGSHFIQASKMRFSPEELVNMVKICNLNHLTQFGTFLSLNIQAAKASPLIFEILRGMKTISYDGVPISYEDDDWCFENHIPLVVSNSNSSFSNFLSSEALKNMYANTECGSFIHYIISDCRMMTLSFRYHDVHDPW